MFDLGVVGTIRGDAGCYPFSLSHHEDYCRILIIPGWDHVIVLEVGLII